MIDITLTYSPETEDWKFSIYQPEESKPQKKLEQQETSTELVKYQLSNSIPSGSNTVTDFKALVKNLFFKKDRYYLTILVPLGEELTENATTELYQYMGIIKSIYGLRLIGLSPSVLLERVNGECEPIAALQHILFISIFDHTGGSVAQLASGSEQQYLQILCSRAAKNLHRYHSQNIRADLIKALETHCRNNNFMRSASHSTMGSAEAFHSRTDLQHDWKTYGDKWLDGLTSEYRSMWAVMSMIVDDLGTFPRWYSYDVSLFTEGSKARMLYIMYRENKKTNEELPSNLQCEIHPLQTEEKSGSTLYTIESSRNVLTQYIHLNLNGRANLGMYFNDEQIQGELAAALTLIHEVPVWARYTGGVAAVPVAVGAAMTLNPVVTLYAAYFSGVIAVHLTDSSTYQLVSEKKLDEWEEDDLVAKAKKTAKENREQRKKDRAERIESANRDTRERLGLPEESNSWFGSVRNFFPGWSSSTTKAIEAAPPTDNPTPKPPS